MENQKLQIIQRILILCFCFLALVVVGGISLYFYLSNSKPEERRLIFEDVAGISRFKINKEDENE